MTSKLSSQGLSTAALLILGLALSGCTANGSNAEEMDVDPAWTWQLQDATIPAQSHIAKPLNLAAAAHLPGTLKVTSGTPVDIIPMTADNYAAFQMGDPFATLPACSAYDQLDYAPQDVGCLLEPGAYFFVVNNRDFGAGGPAVDAPEPTGSTVTFSFQALPQA